VWCLKLAKAGNVLTCFSFFSLGIEVGLEFDILQLAHRHRQDAAAQATAQCGEVAGRIQPGITDEQAASESPGAEILFDARLQDQIAGKS
jgi:hypothetical protein